LSIELPCFQGAGHKIISGMVRRGFHCCYHRTSQNRSGPQPPPQPSVMTFLSKTRMGINGFSTRYALADALPVVAEGFHTTAVKAATIALDAS
jgi:hypothetical protein